jgi:hypothetical protein
VASATGAFALRSPEGTAAARFSPFDPTGPYSAALYRQAAYTRQVPQLFAHRRLSGGGDLQLLEWLRPVPEDEAVAFHRAIAMRTPEVADLIDAVHRVHERARRELPWCGPLDHNPANVMGVADGRLVVADLFYAGGPNLYATAATDPDRVVARIPESRAAVHDRDPPGRVRTMGVRGAGSDTRRPRRPQSQYTTGSAMKFFGRALSAA